MPIHCVVSDKLQIFKTIKSRYLGISFQIIEIRYKVKTLQIYIAVLLPI